MQRSTLILALLLPFVFIVGCHQAAEPEKALNIERSESSWYDSSTNGGDFNGTKPSLDTLPGNILSSSAARVLSDTSRRFIRTADLRFRTPDVINTTFGIETLVERWDGYVANTTLKTNIDHRYSTPISEDRLLETTKFTVLNRMTIRVPSANLDTTLKSLIRYVDLLDHRTVTATDVKLMLLSNRMTQNRIAKHEKRVMVAIDEQGRKLDKTVAAEDKLVDRQEQGDQAMISNLELMDRIAFSTITLEFYQRQSTRHDLLPNEQNIDRYEPGFIAKLKEALITGWEILVEFVLLIARSWSLLALAIAGVLLVRKVFGKKK